MPIFLANTGDRSAVSGSPEKVSGTIPDTAPAPGMRPPHDPKTGMEEVKRANWLGLQAVPRSRHASSRRMLRACIYRELHSRPRRVNALPVRPSLRVPLPEWRSSTALKAQTVAMAASDARLPDANDRERRRHECLINVSERAGQLILARSPLFVDSDP